MNRLRLLPLAGAIVAAALTLDAGVPRGGESDPQARAAISPQLPAALHTRILPEVCYAPDTSLEVLRRNARARVEAGFLQSALRSALQVENFQLSNRWTTTATNGSGLTQGQPTTLTWNVIADGTPIAAMGGIAGESSASSNLKAFLNGIYGSEAVWITHFQSIFDQWSAVTGITYVKVNYDDGVSLANGGVSDANNFFPGVINTRADIRIGGHSLDGPANVLAYNFFPNVGDMVIDTADTFYNNTANNSQGFINVLAHEHGHGIGLSHSCPVQETKLMEPFVSFAFTHVQLDDKLGGWRAYGDDKEDNDTSGTAFDLGSLGLVTSTISDVSIDDNSDVDFYKFTVPANRRAAVTITPIGTTYLAGPQNGDGSCSAGTSFNALTVNDLGVELRSTDGTTILASSNSAGAGVAESIGGTSLPGAGTYFVRVFGGSTDNVQGYQMQLTITDNTGAFVSINDVALTEGDSGTQNAVFTLTRSGTTTSSVSLTAQTANNTAVASADYTAVGATTITFGSGVTTQTFTVPVAGDTLDEPNETFFVNLSSPSAGLTIEDTQGLGTINDNDPTPSLSINDVSVTEGNSGTTNASFTVTLSAASGQTVTVNHATADGTASGAVIQSNAAAIAISAGAAGSASPYPSDIIVSGASGTISKATVTLNSFSHTYTQDVDILLVGPGGKIILMSDVGGGTTDAVNATVTFDDSAAANLTSSALVSGTFKPTNLNDGEGPDSWASPAPATPYGSALSDFNGTSPNGTWSLYVSDDFAGDGGSIAGGWSLNLTINGQDYTATSGTLTYAPGETTKTIVVPVNGDVPPRSTKRSS